MAKPIKGGVYSSPIKLNQYPATPGPKPVNPQTGGPSSKLPKK